MPTVYLSREGIFPITADGHGNAVKPPTGYAFAGTIQGEGKLAGVPSLFVRTQGCNLRCVWTSPDGRPCTCDTSHTSFGGGYAAPAEAADILATIRRNRGNIRHVVITGGEPLLQADALLPVVEALRADGMHVTIETNGTIFHPAIVGAASLMSISPKLSGSEPTPSKLAQLGLQPDANTQRHQSIAIDTGALQSIIDHADDVQLKFVVSAAADEAEIQSLLSQLTVRSTLDVVLMPMGITPEEIAVNSHIAVPMAIRNGWRYTPRLHITMFGNREGV